MIYEQEYKINRTGQTYFANLSQKLESWMHQRVGNSSRKNASTLEIGAGTLNQLDHERETNSYDAIEPMTSLYQESGNKGRIRNFYRDIEEVGEIRKYDRIISIAVLEHITDLPKVIARSGLLLEEGGVSAHGIPSEGGALWGAAWRLTTGISYRIRTGYSYKSCMMHEHINDAPEIIALLKHFYGEVKITRFPLGHHHTSLYTYTEARMPNIELCKKYLIDNES